MPTRMPVMSICDFGLMKLGRLADFLAQLNIRDILLVFTRSEPYIKANPKLTCTILVGARLTCMIGYERLANCKNRTLN